MFGFRPTRGYVEIGLIIFELFFVLAVFIFTAHNLQATEQKKINIDVTTHLGDVDHFQEGDSLVFLISLDRDAYITAIYQNAKGEIIQLIPNRHQQKKIYKSGLFLKLPDAGSAFSFKIQVPFGRETLWVFASDLPWPELKGRYLDDGLKKLAGKMDSIRKSLAKHPKSAYGEASLVLYTHARK